MCACNPRERAPGRWRMRARARRGRAAGSPDQRARGRREGWICHAKVQYAREDGEGVLICRGTGGLGDALFGTRAAPPPVRWLAAGPVAVGHVAHLGGEYCAFLLARRRRVRLVRGPIVHSMRVRSGERTLTQEKSSMTQWVSNGRKAGRCRGVNEEALGKTGEVRARPSPCCLREVSAMAH